MTLEELNLTCDRLEAAQACRNLVGKLSYFDSAFRTNDLIALWADTENAALELDGVSLKGFPAVTEYLKKKGDRNDPGMDIAMRGTLVIHNMNCDALTVAPDAKTAHGTWFSPGIATDLFDPKNPTAIPDKHNTTELDASANYIWQEYALDFLHTDAGWRIQSLKVRTFFDTPFDTPWSESANTMWGRDQIIAEM